jgi:hypothetical protein
VIYFLVNNNYHIELDIRLASQLPGFDLGLIQVPYSLKIITQHNIFKKISCFNFKIHASILRFILHPFEITKIKKIVDNELVIRKDDILMVHTEIDLINQYIIQKFHETGAKVFLLEDGTATMCVYNLFPHRAPLKDRIKVIILKKIYKFRYTEINRYGIQILPVMKDHIFSGIIVNYGDSVLRDIPFYKLKQDKEPISVKFENGAIFFSQPLYLWYLKEDDYIDFLDDLLTVSEEFSPLFFKFHPSDNENVKAIVSKRICENYSRISVIQENDIAENIINKYPVRYAITINSTAALNLINRGIIPLFLNNIFNKKFPDPSFLSFSKFLDSIRCKSPETLAEIRPGFIAIQSDDNSVLTNTLIEIIN